MKRRATDYCKVLIISIFLFLFLACSIPEQHDPETLMIEDFKGLPNDAPPGGSWIVGCETTYKNATKPNDGVIVSTIMGPKGLILMLDALGEPGLFGEGETGYTYAQIEFTAPAAGTLCFSFIHEGWVNYPNPEGTLEFWLDCDIADIAAPPTAPDWTNNSKTNDSFVTQSITINAPGIYRLTWKIEKDWIVGEEDEVHIDDIWFEYSE